MLKLKGIVKDYVTPSQVTHALKGLDVNFRQSEFVSILGPSGCGKTTLLNIIGGLDRYTKGDLIIKGKSTKNYNDRDWDTYRNHSIGFVFQSYNLISHLSLQGNVELALTIGGISRKERQERALKALERVGLGDIAKKKPNQLSGGQMQRVAIARALVNDPEILLADEPTGALDTETSVQIMELLKEVASDRLVIMVTHNPDLAKTYSTRIINMLDGVILSDSMPYEGMTYKTEKQIEKELEKEALAAIYPNLDEEAKEQAIKDVKKKRQQELKREAKKSKMSMGTAFQLSAKNLVSKMKRTALVVVAGSIGIIGVSAVLAISYGVKSYIRNMQDDMLSGNPVQITESSLDLKALMDASSTLQNSKAVTNSIEDGKINVEYMIEFLATQKDNLSTFSIKNDITQQYVDYVDGMPHEYYSAIKKEYGINAKLNFYTDFEFTDPLGHYEQVSLEEVESMYSAIIDKTDFGEFSSMIPMFTDTFASMPDNPDYLLKQYDILTEGGRIATEEDEMMIVVSKDTTLTDIFLGQLGYISEDEFVAIVDKFATHEENSTPLPEKIGYDKLVNKQFTYYPNDKIYTPTGYPPMAGAHIDFNYIGEDPDGTVLTGGTPIKITGILRAKENVQYGALETGFILSPKLEKKMLADSKESQIVTKLKQYQEEYPTYSDEDKTKFSFLVPFTYEYQYKDDHYTNGAGSAVSIVNVGSSGGGMFSDLIASMFGDQYSVESQIKNAIRSTGGNDAANTISVYPLSFDDKYLVTDYLDKWNSDDPVMVNGESVPASARSEIKYNDNLEVIISLVNIMIDIVSIALIAFTSLSLVVSTVMIGIITYVSVIERIKEIGIIRSLGGRKLDVANLFNVETFLIGGFSGLFGISVTYIICLIINIIINSFAKVGTLMILPWHYALIVLGVSILLTLISGLVPAIAAARKDPVIALRSND